MATLAPRPDRLFNRDFVLLWQGQVVSRLGNQAFTIATTLWTLEVTGSATLMGLMLTASRIATVMLGPFAGAFVDSRPRLRTLVACDLGRGVLTCALALSFWALPVEPLVGALFFVALMNGVMAAVFNPAVASITPDLVPARRLAAANSVQQASMQAGTFVGQGLGGVLYQALGAPLLFLFDGITFLFSGVSETLIRHRDTAVSGGQAVVSWAEFRRKTFDGLDYLIQRPGLRAVFLSGAIINLVAMPVVVLLPIYVTDYLHTTLDWYGFLLASLSAGMIGGFAVTALARPTGTNHARFMISMFALLSVALGVLSQVRNPWLALAVMFVSGGATGIINNLEMTLLQQTTPVEFRGRVMGLLFTASEALAPIGMVAGGITADLTGRNIPLIYLVCGAVALTTVIWLSGRNSRQLLASV
ncbi:MAG: MFS transporter [Acidobacteria bacterium]|nr:MFS transporter [Acidobacteriota bacterium]